MNHKTIAAGRLCPFPGLAANGKASVAVNRKKSFFFTLFSRSDFGYLTFFLRALGRNAAR
jgi:hypothetical protein